MADSGAGHEATEEDATELQFPKGVSPGVQGCRGCGAALKEPFVLCATCPYNPPLCLPCFTRGAEFPGHASHHPYAVVGRSCPLGEGWGGTEELALLGAIMECGLGNWGAVSARMAGRSDDECRNHYLTRYLYHPPPELAGLMQGQGVGAGQCVDPMEYVGGTSNPPRPLNGTLAATELAGYCAARGDFECESDPMAENCLGGIEPGLFTRAEEGCPGKALAAAVADGYRRRLGERHRAKRAVRDAGLVGPGRAGVVMARLRPTLPQDLWEALPRLSSLLPPMDIDLVVAGLQAREETRRHISQLQEYRRAGITKKAAVATYETLRTRRQSDARERECLVVRGAGGAGLGSEWVVLGRGPLLSVQGRPGQLRRSQPSLDIAGLPGYSDLTCEEQKVASELRLSPEAFLHHKTLLVGECVRGGGIRLATARTLLKIDVNKTRRIFDVLREAGEIVAVVPKQWPTRPLHCGQGW
ncbi:Transcriptional adapter 2-alpha [Chionoecetes opilio]|uniref:Transcriptional adapter 2-alpha n=1 Tax=Chionoecetes opilio TaxID=41210 RepID=A0A8J5BX21_CHIOP|nr:Transcriptional adapter 2-alpha [Chionoecetes opilio]